MRCCSSSIYACRKPVRALPNKEKENSKIKFIVFFAIILDLIVLLSDLTMRYSEQLVSATASIVVKPNIMLTHSVGERGTVNLNCWLARKQRYWMLSANK